MVIDCIKTIYMFLFVQQWMIQSNHSRWMLWVLLLLVVLLLFLLCVALTKHTKYWDCFLFSFNAFNILSLYVFCEIKTNFVQIHIYVIVVTIAICFHVLLSISRMFAFYFVFCLSIKEKELRMCAIFLSFFFCQKWCIQEPRIRPKQL